MEEKIELLVEGGSATAGPPLGPALGPLGVNAQEVVAEINKLTEDYKNMKIPVEVIVDASTKQFTVKVGSPPTSALILKALGLEKGGGKDIVGDIGFLVIMDIAKKKKDAMLAKTFTAGIKEVAGACTSLRITIEGRSSKELIREVDEGLFDKVIAGKTEEIPDAVVRKQKKVKLVGIKEEKPKEEEKPEEEEAKEGEAKEGESKEGEKKDSKDEKPGDDKAKEEKK